MTTNTDASLEFNHSQNRYDCVGSWSISHCDKLQTALHKIEKSENMPLVLNGSELQHFDSAGALVLYQLILRLQKQGNKIHLIHFSKDQMHLLDILAENKDTISYHAPLPSSPNLLYKLGVESVRKMHQATGLLNLIGDLCTKIFYASGQWERFRFKSIMSVIDSAGLQALPILAMLSFLIGVVLAYQMGLQLKTYGANTYIAYLTGMAIFREFGPLITAIILAGRTSSAFTAQIGSMKINEEIDALKTMGLSPTELLVMPKVIGLLLVFPLLVFWSDFFSVIGAMLMAKGQLNISYADFLARLQESVGLKHMRLGLYKAPTFSLIIALVGCYQGFAVQANADSIGAQTTKSVVQAIFLIIIADASYTVFYNWMDL